MKVVRRGLAYVVVCVLVCMLGGCGLVHGMVVRNEAMEACAVPAGGKRVAADDLWTVMWNQKTFATKVTSPMSVEETRDFYKHYLTARGWDVEGERPPIEKYPDYFLQFHRGSKWGEFIRWHYQSLDVTITPDGEGRCTVVMSGWFEYAPATWPRYLVVQGLGIVFLPVLPLGLLMGSEQGLAGVAGILAAPVAYPAVFCVVVLF